MSTSPAPTADPGGAAPSAPVVRFDQVSLASRGDLALRGLSFALQSGSFHWLTGARGAGKTSLLEVIGLVRRPSQGVAQVFGRDVAALGRKEVTLARRRIGFIPTAPTFVEHFSVWDNAAFAASVTGRRRQSYQTEVEAILKWTGLARAAGALPAVLTAADRHRLALARALVNRPELLLIDEPDEGVDDAARRRIWRLAQEVHGAGTTVVMVSRDEAFAATSRAPAIRLRDGRAIIVEPEAA